MTVALGLEIAFRDPALLRLALTHSSFVNERPGEAPESNERLEYLGDAVLGLAIARELYDRYPHYAEGQLTEMRSRLVRSETLAAIAMRLNIGEQLLMGRGEAQSGGRIRESNLASALEAVIGAVFLDQGYDAARLWVLGLFGRAIDEQFREPLRDFKSQLQEQVQSGGHPAPSYRTVCVDGPDHHREFTVEVVVDGEVLGTGRGASKRVAQQEAAREALDRLAMVGSRTF